MMGEQPARLTDEDSDAKQTTSAAVISCARAIVFSTGADTRIGDIMMSMTRRRQYRKEINSHRVMI